MNEEIIFKWDRKFIKKCIWKSGYVKFGEICLDLILEELC